MPNPIPHTKELLKLKDLIDFDRRDDKQVIVICRGPNEVVLTSADGDLWQAAMFACEHKERVGAQATARVIRDYVRLRQNALDPD